MPRAASLSFEKDGAVRDLVQSLFAIFQFGLLRGVDQ
jgi:hypothetical protein